MSEDNISVSMASEMIGISGTAIRNKLIAGKIKGLRVGGCWKVNYNDAKRLAEKFAAKKKREKANKKKKIAREKAKENPLPAKEYVQRRESQVFSEGEISDDIPYSEADRRLKIESAREKRLRNLEKMNVLVNKNEMSLHFSSLLRSFFSMFCGFFDDLAIEKNFTPDEIAKFKGQMNYRMRKTMENFEKTMGEYE